MNNYYSNYDFYQAKKFFDIFKFRKNLKNK